VPKLKTAEITKRAAKIKLALMDVDGVLTGGQLFHFVDTTGELVELKGIHAHDSIALSWLAQSGIATGLISGRISRGVDERARQLKVSYVYQHRLDKKNVFDEICEKEGVRPEEVLFIGDDLQDIPVITACGLGIAVKNARPEVHAAAHLSTKASGGQGAVREVTELVLKAQGKWQAILQRFPPSR
jgi:3-deoxy-D-manno-octulosonate 8-phosphate phosphatase (KDO 8-P phosphatase)